MIRITRSKSSESDDEISIGDASTEETGSFDRAIAIIRYGMRLLGFWPQDTHLLCNLRYGVIIALIGFFTFPQIVQALYTMVYTVTDSNSVMHQVSDIVPMIPVLSRFIFMKVMAKNFRFVLHTMITDWADYRYLMNRGRRIMVYYAGRGRRFIILNTALSMLSVIGYILTPVMNVWRSDGLWNLTMRSLPLEGVYPFRNKESPVYEILYVAQSFVLFFGVTAVFTVDCFLYIIVFHVCGQFDILAATLKRYNSSIRHLLDTKDTLNCACSSCIAKRHVHILSYVDIVERSFRDFLLSQLLEYGLILVLYGRELILQVRHNNINGIVTCIIYVLTVMYFIFIYCYISECIIEKRPTKSENVGRIARNQEWQRSPRDLNLPIIVARTSVPCKLTAGRFFILSLPCYTTILTTTISYISVLAAMK